MRSTSTLPTQTASRWLPAVAIAVAIAGGVAAQPALSPELKRLSLEDLLNTEVTSVAKFSQPLMDAASSVQVISNETLRRSAVLTIPEALRLADNLNVAQKNPHDWAVSARGFNANLGDKMLVLIDGRSVYTPLFGGVFWNVQDYVLEDVDRIEAISGPGGTLWGANAVNGVVNITTKSADKTQGLFVDVGAGMSLHEAGALRYGGRLAPNIYYRVYGKYLSEGDGTLEGGGKAMNAWHQSQGGFRIDATPAPGQTLTLQGDGYSADLGLQSPASAARLAGGNVLARWTQVSAGDVQTRVQAYVDRNHLSDPFPATQFAPFGYLKDNIDTYDVELQSTRQAGRHHLIWGLDYRHIVDRQKQPAPNFGFRPGDRLEDMWSVFAQDELALSRTLTLIAGSKLEHNSFTGFEIQPNLRLRWKPSSTLMWWGGVTRAVRTPTRLDRDLAEPYGNALIKGGPTFGSEGLLSYEAGVRTQMNPSTSASLVVFYNEYDHLRGLSLTPRTAIPLVYSNTLEGETHGLELTADHRPFTWWRLAAGFTLLREHLHVRPGRTDFFNALDETEDPEEQFSIRSSVDLPQGVQFDAQYRWVGSLRVNNGGKPGTVPAYSELNARVTWPVSVSTDISLVGENLLDTHHAEYGPPSPSREQLRRLIYAKITLRF